MSAWSPATAPSQAQLSRGPLIATEDQIDARRELLETLDRLIVHENYYHSIYGKFTSDLARVGFSIPARVGQQYEIRVLDASPTKLLVSAHSGNDGRLGDIASIDQSFRLEANFPVPMPRAEYLRVQAMKHLRSLQQLPSGHSIAEQGVFRDYFRYERTFAVGVRPPVLGIQVEIEKEQQDDSMLEMLGELAGSGNWAEPAPGQNSQQTDLMSTAEEAYLAQKIFYGELGRYARSWSELAKIADFRFEERASFPNAAVPYGETASVSSIKEIDLGRQDLPENGRAPANAVSSKTPEPVRDAAPIAPIVVEPL